jgi:Ca2+-binding RTX toxin-like protein
MAVTIPGANGQVLVFNVSGMAATAFAESFAQAIGTNGVPSTILTLPGSTESTVAGSLNEIFYSGVLTSYTLTTGDQYTFVSSGNPFDLTGSTTGGDSVIGGADLTYNAVGGNNVIVFTDGDNTFTGSSVGGDTVAAGSGHDTINATNNDAIYGGTGSALINISGTNDSVALFQGSSTVDITGSGSNLVIAGSTASVLGGSGDTYILGLSNADVTYSASSGQAAFFAGAGNETLSGAGADGSLFVYVGSAASTGDTVTSGGGDAFFITGAGNQDLTAGSGLALFDIASPANATITINDFASGDFVAIAGLTQSAAQAAIAGGTVSGGSLDVTLSDGTKITFTGVTSINSGHII